MTGGESLVLVLSGFLGIYCEFVRPGRVLPCVGGFLLAVTGIYHLSRLPLTDTGLILVGMASLLFLLETFWRIDFVAGAAGTGFLSAGSTLLVKDPASIPPAVAIPASALFAAVTVFLCWEAKRGHRNKLSDLAAGTPVE